MDLTLGHVSAREPGARHGLDQAQGMALDEVRRRGRHRARPDDPGGHLRPPGRTLRRSCTGDLPGPAGRRRGHPQPPAVLARAWAPPPAAWLFYPRRPAVPGRALGIYDDGPGHCVPEASQGRAVAGRWAAAGRRCCATTASVMAGRGHQLGRADRADPGAGGRIQFIARTLGETVPTHRRGGPPSCRPASTRRRSLDEYWAPGSDWWQHARQPAA